MARVGISLGSNLGDRLANLRNAIRRLRPLQSTGRLLCSSIYESEPVDCGEDAPLFFNAAIEMDSILSPVEILKETQLIELELGRPSDREPNAPRTIDIDILYYDDIVFDSRDLTLPHPRMMQRAFVLLPLSEIRNEFNDAAKALEGQNVRKTDEEWLSD